LKRGIGRAGQEPGRGARFRKMRIEEIMNKSVVTVEMDDSLKRVKEIFDNLRFHHLLVVETGELVGVISDRDLLKALSPNIGTAAETFRDSATLKKKVHQVMTRKLVTLEPKAGIDDAIEIFNKYNISCIPVVDEEHKPVGIISWRDILRAISRETEEGGGKEVE
jgi:acetoin utilization protein AcuB